MSRQPAPLGDVRQGVSPTSPGRNPWTWLRFARRAWIVLALLLMIYFVASIPVYYQALSTLCTRPDPDQCANGQLTLGHAQALAQLHLSVAAFAGVIATLEVAVSLLCWVVGGLIFWRASREWTGLFFSLLLVVVGATELSGLVAGITVISATPLLLQILVAVSGVFYAVQSATLVAFVLTFPTGRLVPRWSGILIVLVVVIQSGLPAILPRLSPSPVLFAVVAIVWLVVYAAMIGVQVYRFQRVYDAMQRQQTKWFVFAVGVAMVLLVSAYGPGVVPSLSAPDSWYQLLIFAISPVTLASLPLGVGIAILRYRLWDVDVLINRALVYGSLTALLVALYVGLVLSAQALVRILTGSLSQQPVVLVASTLAIAALVQPLRHRLQTTIDGRFYRRKYDAAKVVAAFSSSLRHEVDLDELRAQLVAVVQETMQPTHVAVWLRPANHERKPNTTTS